MARRKAVLYTIGYEGRSVSELTSILRDNGVELLLDVRERASSRKRGFSKVALKEALEKQGISYQHYPELGAPPELREKVKADGDFEYFQLHYLDHLVNKRDILSELANLAAALPVALLCYESDPEKCHRSIVAKEIAASSGGALTVKDL